jgi:hypothetical protein
MFGVRALRRSIVVVRAVRVRVEPGVNASSVSVDDVGTRDRHSEEATGDAPPALVILGDSLSAGYGALCTRSSSCSPVWSSAPTSEDPVWALPYAGDRKFLRSAFSASAPGQLCWKLQANCYVVAFSGWGVVVPHFGQLLPSVFGRTLFTVPTPVSNTSLGLPAPAVPAYNFPAHAVFVVNVGTNDLNAPNPPSIQAAARALATLLVQALKPSTPLVVLWCGQMRAPTCSMARQTQAMLVGSIPATTLIRVLDFSSLYSQNGGVGTANHPTFGAHATMAAALFRTIQSLSLQQPHR